MTLPAMTSLTRPDAAAGSTAQRLYDSLRHRIVMLDLPPGTVLSRVELTVEYAVSQTPLREALQRLAQDGLVAIRPQSRTVVTPIDTNQLREAHFLRVALECEVARGLAEAPPEGLIPRLRSILRMQQAVAEDPNQYRLFQELDEMFHQTLFDTMGQPELYRLIRERSGHMERVRQLNLPEKGKTEHILRLHKEIVDAIASSDPELAVAQTRAHLGNTVRMLEGLRERHPHYFA
ncbi:GntR family transcriptional regulator [Falsirhodobacter sp. alg1]|uniref:GntR family transcriptional regulator n=1 Tax=Falsirhodobacter sp. alg1 TaxID=1472418 RepID=UPI0005EDAAD7|nr:GntR family transcriptional regulator [Falsirhodobacter sp. alg1]